MYKFLFVDDEDLMRDLFADLLDFRAYGFELAAACASAEEALAYLRKHPDTALVITDIKMGKMSGIDFCEEIRRAGSSVEIVIVSGYAEFEFAQKAIRNDVFDYLLKPTSYGDLERLFTRLKAHLDSTRPETPGEETEYYYTQLIDAVKRYIRDNYSRNLTLEDAAKYVSLNPSYLSRFFKQQTGTNFIDYLSQVRIEKAKQLLQDGTVKVYEIGDMVGYRNTQYFYKIFKQLTGVTPSEFRKNIGGR